MKFVKSAALLVTVGLFLSGIQGAQADPAPGTVVFNKFRSTKQIKNGVIDLKLKLGPYAGPVHIFMTALGSARLGGGSGTLRTSILFDGVVHATNRDDFALPQSSSLAATANFDFILSKGQTTSVEVTSTVTSNPPANPASPELKFFYKGIAVICPGTIC
jgi:hypothetical protein